MAQSKAFADASHTLNDLSHALALLESENSKLRELVRDMWFGLHCPTEPTDGCPQCTFNKDGECFFEQRMRELGIEVDG